MTFFVKVIVILTLVAAILLGRDDRSCALTADEIDDGGGIIRLVSNDIASRPSLEQGDGRDAVVNLPAGKFEANRITQRIDDHMNFNRQAAPAAADSLGVGPLFAPAECWWART